MPSYIFVHNFLLRHCSIFGRSGVKVMKALFLGCAVFMIRTAEQLFGKQTSHAVMLLRWI